VPCSTPAPTANTAAIAIALARGVFRATGGAVGERQLRIAPPKQLLETNPAAEPLLIGSPTLGGHAPPRSFRPWAPCWPKATGPSLWDVFGSYGWSGERGSTCWKAKLRDGGFRFRLRDHPGEVQPRRAPPSSGLEENRTGPLGRKLLGQASAAANGSPPVASARAQQHRGAGPGRIVARSALLTPADGEAEPRCGKCHGASLGGARPAVTPRASTVGGGQGPGGRRLKPCACCDAFTPQLLLKGDQMGPMKQFLAADFRPAPTASPAWKKLEKQPLGPAGCADGDAWLGGRGVRPAVECGDHWACSMTRWTMAACSSSRPHRRAQRR